MERRNRTLHHRQMVSRGTDDAALFCRRNPRLHHLEFENESPLFPTQELRGAGNKNPSGAWARRGSIKSNCGRASAHPALARKRARCTAQVERPVGIRLRDEWRGAHHQSLSAVAGDNRKQRARCMIGDRGEVKACVPKKWDTRSLCDQPGLEGRGCYG